MAIMEYHSPKRGQLSRVISTCNFLTLALCSILVAILFAGCGGNGDDKATDTQPVTPAITLTATATPTATVTSNPTPTVTFTPAVTPTQTPVPTVEVLTPTITPALTTITPTQAAPSQTPSPSPTTTPATPEVKTIDFIWEVDSGIRLSDATVPYICHTADGRFRLYYGGEGGINSAISTDGITFEKESGVRVEPGSQGGSETIVSDPTVVTLSDGRVRMYYKGATGPGGPDQSVHKVFSAISTDGLNFVKEGLRIDSDQTPDRGWASVPEAIRLPDGHIRIYYVSNGLDIGHGVVSAISTDGLSFTREDTKVAGYVDPAIIRLSDGTYLMLAVAIIFGSEESSSKFEPGIYSFTSEDGITFTDPKLVLSGENNIDPAIIEVSEGIYRVYYWNIMDNPSVIKSITGRLK